MIVDVLSFCTSVDIAVGRGARVLPQRWADAAVESEDAAAPSAATTSTATTSTPTTSTVATSAAATSAAASEAAATRGAAAREAAAASSVAAREAAAAGAVSAGRRDGTGPSLRPSSLVGLPPDTLLALPSPNGATLCAAAARHGAVVLAGCLRNATAVAAAALAVGRPIGLVPAGERWPDDTLRAAAEDALGAGAIAARLQQGGTAAAESEQCHPAAVGDGLALSPEAQLVAAQFAEARKCGLLATLSDLASGRELIADGYGADVQLAADLDVSAAAPRLVDGILRG